VTALSSSPGLSQVRGRAPPRLHNKLFINALDIFQVSQTMQNSTQENIFVYGTTQLSEPNKNNTNLASEPTITNLN
jgi:hypothetical protein